jgi:uncharacterized protein DUF222/HNH endonuclease
VRALVRVATPSDEAELVRQATGLTATGVEAMVRGLRAVSAEEAAEANRRRSLRWRWRSDDRTLRLVGRFPDVDGAVVACAIERIAERCAASPDDPDPEPWDARCADALVELASCSLPPDAEGGRGQGEAGEVQAQAGAVQGEAGEAHAEDKVRRTPVRETQAEAGRALVVVHVEAGVLACGGAGAATLECGVAVASETVRRLACDASLQAVVEGQGRPLGAGRRRRTVPKALLHVLRHRDGGCRFPGCTRTRWVQSHHVRHWADGGPTEADNLVLLCGAHHRFVHEGGWRIEGDPAGDLRFVHPDGRRLRVGPAGLRPEVARRFEVAPWLPLWAEWGAPDLAGAGAGNRSP